MKRIRLIVPLAAAVMSFAHPYPALSAQGPDVAVMRGAVEAAEKAAGTRPGDFTLIDQDGAKFKLSDYFGSGRALVVSFIYTDCRHVCPGITAGLRKATEEARLKYGDKFNVLTVGFDAANDTPQRLKEYGARFTRDFKRFRFAAADGGTLREMTRRFGFFYQKSGAGDFDHIDMVTVMRSDGTIFRQAYSVRTRPETVTETLGWLLTGAPPASGTASLMEKLKFFCYKYDPYTGTYVIDYPVIAGVGIQAAVLGAIVWLVWGRFIRGFFSRRIKG